MSMEQDGGAEGGATSGMAKEDSSPDLSAMTEEEQIAYAMRMSMQDTGTGED